VFSFSVVIIPETSGRALATSMEATGPDQSTSGCCCNCCNCLCLQRLGACACVLLFAAFLVVGFLFFDEDSHPVLWALAACAMFVVLLLVCGLGMKMVLLKASGRASGFMALLDLALSPESVLPRVRRGKRRGPAKAKMVVSEDLELLYPSGTNTV